MENTEQQIVVWKKSIMGAERKFTEIAAAEGNLVTYQKEAMFAMQTLQNSDYLQKSDPLSIRDAVINVASIGLSLNPALAFAYLVPRDGKCCLDISYKGMVKIATDTGSIQWAKAELVRQDDNFEYNGFGEMPGHKYNPFKQDRGDVIGAYCVAKLHDGSVMVEVMDRAELNKVKESSKASSAKAPWNAWPTEMMKKTIIKRAYKSWPKTSPRMDEAIHVVNEHEGLDLREYTDEQKIHFDSMIEKGDSVGMTVFMGSLPDDTQAGLHNSFEKGKKSKGKEEVRRLISEGHAIISQWAEELTAHADNDDSAGVNECMEEMDEGAKDLVWARIPKDQLCKLEIILAD